MNAALRRHVPWLAWLAPLVFALTLVGWDASGRIHRSLELSRRHAAAVAAPEMDASSVTGYVMGRRLLVPPVLAPDAMHWVMQTQGMVHRGESRVRWTAVDNAPDGRPVHWGAPYRWWLVVLAHVDHAITGVPLPLAIERAVLWAGPVLLILVLVLLAVVQVRQVGHWGALLTMLGLAGNPGFSVQFAAGNADHHGAAALCAVLAVILLPRSPHARAAQPLRAALPAALAGAAGLWLSAATLLPVLAGVVIGAAAARLRLPADAMPDDPDGRFWRYWGAVGACATGVAYLIEYAPSGFAWRLEVIHPLYALAWWGAAEWVARARRGSPPGGRAPASHLVGAVAGLTVLLPAGLVLAYGGTVFLPVDSFLSSFHTNYIAEFQSLPELLRRQTTVLSATALLAPGALLVLAVVSDGRRAQPWKDATAAASLFAAAVTAVMACVQIRWWGLAAPLCLVVAIDRIEADTVATAPRRRIFLRGAALLLFLPGVLSAAFKASTAHARTAIDMQLAAIRAAADHLRIRTSDTDLVVAAPPESTTQLAYYAGAAGLGTLYWENLDGLKKSAAFFSARSPEAALSLATRWKLTHVVLPSWDLGDEHCARLALGLPPSAVLPPDTISATLRMGVDVSWLKPVALLASPSELESGGSILLFEVVPPRSAGQIAADRVAFLLDMGRFTEATKLEPVLARHANDLSAQAMLALVQARRRDASAFSRTLERLGALGAAVDGASLETRIHVVMAYAIAGREEAAEHHLRAALATTHAPAMRRLSPRALGDLLELSDALKVPIRDPEAAQVARDLDPRKSRLNN